MRILVDAMGGDNAPDQIALGAIQAAKDFGCEVVLVGRGEAILRALKDQGIETLPKGVPRGSRIRKPLSIPTLIRIITTPNCRPVALSSISAEDA